MPNALASDTPNPTYSRGRVCALTDVSRNSTTCKRRSERSCRLEAPPMSLEVRLEDSPKCRVRHPEPIHIQPTLRRAFKILYNIHVDKSTTLAVGDVIDAIRQPGPGNNHRTPSLYSISVYFPKVGKHSAIVFECLFAECSSSL